MEPGQTIRSHVWVDGRVQGVWFRDACRRLATQLGVTGWVRNLADGRVEAVFDGAPEAVQRMVDWCRSGPPRAVVTDIRVIEEPPGHERGFKVV